MRRHLEDDLQRAVAQLLDGLGWAYFHVPNGGWRKRSEAARMAGLGVKPGVPDLVIAEPWSCGTDGGPMVAIELKSRTGRLTKNQRAWLGVLQSRKWLVAVCRTVDEVMDVLHFVQPLNGRKPVRRGKPPEDPRQIDWTQGGKK